MLPKIHYRVQYICKIKPFLSTFNRIISSYLPCQDMKGYLKFRLYKSAIIKNVESYYEKIKRKNDSYFQNPLYLNAFYAGLSLLKLKHKDIIYLFKIIQTKKKLTFTMPPIQLFKCSKCIKYREVQKINNKNFFCKICFQKINI